MALAAGCDDPSLPLLFITTQSQSHMPRPAVSVTSALLGSDSSAPVNGRYPSKGPFSPRKSWLSLGLGISMILVSVLP
ncbi:uncharacterized protein N7479_005616 [Penicillium vulpinum]|uniref:uncharacterized protein n=1 Tax=Penicillium vulpinum TaxID=29845 RepID=UPI002549ADF7|nr:uncharacterized protein N7479_005616 [Penicillium vulpinum]KAJ5958466.1 hypothetical protein N7479_005616 [Penicillium vulpinum]